ncbi:WD40 repeat domain-containing protein [Roseibium sediminicola]|uniref:FG-GAP repeat protein n=1 Tax=Roseibium sediminicola TaxID=2933272 RepID=A0ABT0H277_9HYPH|nr:FG-GAP repeat protein [Roseibium sp. CAU 1639]MCK7615402.1 FG-GAP repeat protein [Roseibium sp. CAU 1639]
MSISERPEAEDTSSDYPVFAPYAQLGAKLVGSNALGDSQQGTVAISADGTTAVVGGSNDNEGTGAIWIFVRSGDSWTQQGAKLTGSDGVGAPGLGTSVAISEDGNTVIAGGSGDNGLVGAAWVFTRTNGIWTQQGAKLVGSGYVGEPMQGAAVGLSADGNTAAIGGNGDDYAVGAVWIFTRSTGTWSQSGSKLVGSGYSGKANQGAALALSGDGQTLVIGSALEVQDTAPVWVFANSGGWQQQGNYLTGSGGVPDPYGQNTALAVSHDGSTFVLGENQDNGQTGATWIFTRTSGIWTQEGSKLVGTGATGTAGQGGAVAISSDGKTIAVGGDDDNSDEGAVWVFQKNSGTWLQCGEKLVGTGASGKALQGTSVALSGDGRTILSGGPGDNSMTGATWVFAAQFIA